MNRMFGLTELAKDAACQRHRNRKAEEIRVFIHYHPQFYHLHIHFTRLWNDIGCQVERAHLLDEVIINLEQDDQHYANKTIFYKLNEGEKLAMVVAAPN